MSRLKCGNFLEGEGKILHLVHVDDANSETSRVADRL